MTARKRDVHEEMASYLGVGYGDIGEPMRRHHVIPLVHPIPATTEPNPSSLPATKPETQPSEGPELEPTK